MWTTRLNNNKCKLVANKFSFGCLFKFSLLNKFNQPKEENGSGHIV